MAYQAGFVSKAAAVAIFQLKVFDTKTRTVGKPDTTLTVGKPDTTLLFLIPDNP
jgi:hypothetical protein